ncbi:MAG: hypothetical protein H6706_00720 [Myxococcales bacterium]|nr:hypothetical protein [Myxococcales bacterium]
MTRYVLALALGLFGCDDGGGGGGSPAPTPDMGGLGGEGGGAGGEGGGAGGAGGGQVEQPLARSPGRMAIAQLARSIPVVTDGIRWTEDFGAGPTDMLEVLAPTLGAPDYLRVTQENLEPTLIVAKFVQDAAFRICGQWAQRDRAAAAGERSLVRDGDWDSLDEAHAKANLRALQLRFYARQVADDDDAPIADLYELFENASSTAPAGRGALDGWTAVCIAMMTDPEFILY